MFITKPSKLALTLILYVAVVLTLAASTTEAKGFTAVPRRAHVGLNRMVRKRADPLASIISSGINQPVAGAAADPPTGSSSAAVSTSASSSAAASSSAVASSASSSSAVASTSSASSTASSSAASSSASSSATSSTSDLVSSVTSSVTTSSTTSSTASSTTSSSTASATSSSATPTTTPQQQTTQAAQASQAVSQQPASSSVRIIVTQSGGGVVTLFSNAPAASSTASSDTTSKSGSTSVSHTALIVIIVLASSIGGIAIIWTVIRKWKFRPSSQFEDRMQPIDWQPAEHESGLPTHHRMSSNASSFHSAGHEGGGAAGVGAGYGATSEMGHAAALNPIPDHDFTAGPTTLAPVGGYADLARGPSPQPTMQELGRGPSLNRGYDQYGVPLHHQAGGYDYGRSAGY